MAAKRQTDDTAPVSFRIDSMYKQMLEDRAAPGVSRHIAARDLLIEALNRESADDLDLKKIASQVAEIRSQLKELRVDLAVAVQALLVASERMTFKQAEQWVNENLLHKGGS